MVQEKLSKGLWWYDPRAEFEKRGSITKAKYQENGIKTLPGFKDYV
jgi:hypothetical protein